MRFLRLRRIHFVGAGGVGMSGIAEILLQATPLEISGCDLVPSDTSARLERLGAKIAVGHDPSHVENADLVVISSAVAESNAEVAAARARGIPVIRRAEMLGEIMRLKQGVAVAGTHGKTTTTSLTGMVLTEAGFDPTIVVGGQVHILGTNARLGRGDYLVAEADEYDRSFLELTPVVAVITNIEADHLDTYRDLSEIRDAFAAFANSVPFFGAVVACADDPGVREILPRIKRRVVTYGESPDARLVARDVRLEGSCTAFDVWDAEQGRLGAVRLRLPGRHNVWNALAAVAAGRELLIPFDRRLVALFQPHLYSRTRDFTEDFGRALSAADVNIVMDVYPSREAPIPGVTGEIVADAARRAGHAAVIYTHEKKRVVDTLEQTLTSGDLLVTLGAGDVVKFGEEYLRRGQR